MFHHWIEKWKMSNAHIQLHSAYNSTAHPNSKIKFNSKHSIKNAYVFLVNPLLLHKTQMCCFLLNLYLFVIILSVWYTNYSLQRLGYECSVYLIHRTIFLYSFFVCFFDICAIASRCYIAYVSSPHSLFRIEELKRSNKQTQE